tara:strand:- start:6334 stop:6546 length:213 start_codon:yes stop_codon:yes gene_type:complete
MNRKQSDIDLINLVVDLYSSSGKGFRKAKRFLRKKFAIKVSENELETYYNKLKVKRFEHLEDDTEPINNI